MAAPLQQEDVVALLEQGIMPPNWDITCSKVTFGLLKTLFEQLEILCIPQSNIIQICAKLCDKSEDAISKTINKIGQVYNADLADHADLADLLDKHDFQVREMWSAF